MQKDQQNLRYLPPNSESSLSSMLISRLRVKGIAKLKQIECTVVQLNNYIFFKRMNRIDLSAHNAIRRHGRYLPNGGRCMAIGCITGIGLIWGIIWGTIWGTTWGSVGGKLVFFIDLFLLSYCIDECLVFNQVFTCVKKKILMILSVGERWKYLYQNVNLA